MKKTVKVRALKTIDDLFTAGQIYDRQEVEVQVGQSPTGPKQTNVHYAYIGNNGRPKVFADGKNFEVVKD